MDPALHFRQSAPAALARGVLAATFDRAGDAANREIAFFEERMPGQVIAIEIGLDLLACEASKRVDLQASVVFLERRNSARTPL